MKRLGNKRVRRMLVALLVLGLLGTTRPVHAGQGGSRAKAKEYFLKGVAAFKVQNYAVALVWFQRSYKIRPKAVVLYNIAMCHRALFAYTKSIAVFKKYLSMMGSRLRPDKRRKIERFIQEMMAKLARVVLAVQPSGARILLDGEFKGTAPSGESITLMASPGTHVLEVTKPDYRPYRKEITVVEGQQTALSVILATAGQPKGTLILQSPVAGATGIVDGGRPLSLPAILKVDAGAHNVTVTAPGHRPKALVLSVQPGAVLRQTIRLEPVGAPEPRGAAAPVGLPGPDHVSARTPARTPSAGVARPSAARLVSPRPRHDARRTVPPAAVQPVATEHKTPWYKTWWFWTSVGVAVVAGAAVGGYAGYKSSQGGSSQSFDTLVTLK